MTQERQPRVNHPQQCLENKTYCRVFICMLFRKTFPTLPVFQQTRYMFIGGIRPASQPNATYPSLHDVSNVPKTYATNVAFGVCFNCSSKDLKRDTSFVVCVPVFGLKSQRRQTRSHSAPCFFSSRSRVNTSSACLKEIEKVYAFIAIKAYRFTHRRL